MESARAGRRRARGSSAARSLPMPGSSSSCFSSMRATGSPMADRVGGGAIRADLEEFSPLISRRSAISEKICAIGWLSTRRPSRSMRVVERRAPPAASASAIAGALAGRTVAEQASAAAGAAHLGRRRAGRHGPRDETRRWRESSRQARAACGCPIPRHRPTNAVPITALSASRMATAVSRIRSKQSKTWRSPSICSL